MSKELEDIITDDEVRAYIRDNIPEKEPAEVYKGLTELVKRKCPHDTDDDIKTAVMAPELVGVEEAFGDLESEENMGDEGDLAA